MYKTLIVCILSFIAVILLGGVAGWCAWMYFFWYRQYKKLQQDINIDVLDSRRGKRTD